MAASARVLSSTTSSTLRLPQRNTPRSRSISRSAASSNRRAVTVAAIDPESAAHLVNTVTDAHMVDAVSSSTSGPLAELANFLAPAADKGLYGKVNFTMATHL